MKCSDLELGLSRFMLQVFNEKKHEQYRRQTLGCRHTHW